MNELNKMIGKRIKDRRNELGFTQKELAQRIGCAEITVRQYESGRNAPKIETRAALAKALDLPYGVLFNPDDEELAAMLPEVGVNVENDPEPVKTRSAFNSARIEDISQDLAQILAKTGLATTVNDSGSVAYYLHGEDRKAVKLRATDYESYLKRQIANIANYHYGYVDIIRSLEAHSDSLEEDTPSEDPQS